MKVMIMAIMMKVAMATVMTRSVFMIDGRGWVVIVIVTKIQR